MKESLFSFRLLYLNKIINLNKQRAVGVLASFFFPHHFNFHLNVKLSFKAYQNVEFHFCWDTIPCEIGD